MTVVSTIYATAAKLYNCLLQVITHSHFLAQILRNYPHDSPHFQMAPKVSAKTGSSASIVVNRSINGSNRTSGIVGINS